MKQNWWKLLVVVVLVAAVAGVVATKNRGTDKAGTPTVEKSATVTSDDKPAVETVETESSDANKSEMSEPAADSVENQVQSVAAAVDKLEEDTKVSDAAKERAAQKPEASVPKTEESRLNAEPVKKTGKAKQLPKLMDFGATKCIPCKLMAPILEELSREHKGKLEVGFVDVWKNEDIGKKYGIQSIPTQVFFDENGKEFFRHNGFIPKDEILAKFKEHGIDLQKETRNE